MADPVAKPARFVEQIARPGQVEAVLALVQQQQTLELWHSFPQCGRQLLSRFRKAFKCDVQCKLLVSGIRKGFQLDNSLRQSAGPRHFLHLREGFRKAGLLTSDGGPRPAS